MRYVRRSSMCLQRIYMHNHDMHGTHRYIWLVSHKYNYFQYSADGCSAVPLAATFSTALPRFVFHLQVGGAILMFVFCLWKRRKCRAHRNALQMEWINVWACWNTHLVFECHITILYEAMKINAYGQESLLSICSNNRNKTNICIYLRLFCE